MELIQMKVVYKDGREVVVTAEPADQVAFERQFNVSIEALEHPRMEWLYYLAWSPLHAEGAEPGSFDEFLQSRRVLKIEGLDKPAQVEAAPLAPSPEWSPTSP
jgi:hypothetical protein